MIRYMHIGHDLYPMNTVIEIEEAVRSVVIYHQGQLDTMAVREIENPVIRLWKNGMYELGEDIQELDANDPLFHDVILVVGINHVEHNDTLLIVQVDRAGNTWVVSHEPMSPVIESNDLMATLNEIFNEDSDEDYGDDDFISGDY